jgi:hypothetical protein
VRYAEKVFEGRAQFGFPFRNHAVNQHRPATHEELPPNCARLFKSARPKCLDTKALSAQGINRTPHSLTRLHSNWRQTVILEESNGNLLQIFQGMLLQGNRCSSGIGFRVTREYAKKQRYILNRASHWPNGSEKRKWPSAWRQVTIARNTPWRRL